MARGASPAPPPLPKVSFLRVQDDYTNQPTGVHDQQARSYGYNDFSDFRRPEHYIRYIEPLESELAVQVEYDMDEQDQEWLDAVNADRKKEQMDKVSYEVFEIVMDRLEKEWFDLTKNIPKPDLALPSEDSTCAICDDSEGENTNAIVFCDGCNLAVHQDCYGVPYIPEGQWLCRKCTVSPENPVSCILCPNEGGAFKQTVHGDWVHLLCAIWVPETRVANDVFMEPITGVERISKQRWRLKCSICDVRQGACIQCTKSSCFLAFHATCARKERLLMPMKSSQGSEAPTLACYCEKHLPREQAETRAAALAAEKRNEVDAAADDTPPSPKSSKTARAYAKTYKPGPPLVPNVIVERILQYIGKVTLRHKREFVQLVCKYWSLKREGRRGAAFLKRLHLEPWTASAGARQQTDEEKLLKLELMKRLRGDLERVRTLAELSRKRESRKRDQAEAIQDVFSHFLFSHEPSLRMVFERVMGFDRLDYFKNPVSKTEVPDYFEIIKKPMCWNMIDRKLDRHEYLDLQDFKNDVDLVLTNAMTYNEAGTTFHKAAQRIKTSIEPVMAELDRLVPSKATEENAETSQADQIKPAIGDLEPPLYLLGLLVSEGAIKDETDLIIDKEPLDSLFSYEFPQFRPPPPPPPPKPKRNRKADRERKRLEREAQARNLDGSPGFRAPRTRRAAAVAAAFEAEVGGSAVASSSTAAAAEEEETPSVPSPAKSSKKSKHKPAPPPAPVEPPVVQDVNSQQSFKMFDHGWILPSDQRRGGRPPIERHPLPPSKKKSKSTRAKSHLSTLSTSALRNQILHATPPPPEGAPDEVLAVSELASQPMDVDQPSAEAAPEPMDVDQMPVEPGPELMDVDQVPAEPAPETMGVNQEVEEPVPEPTDAAQMEHVPEFMNVAQTEHVPEPTDVSHTEPLLERTDTGQSEHTLESMDAGQTVHIPQAMDVDEVPAERLHEPMDVEELALEPTQVEEALKDPAHVEYASPEPVMEPAQGKRASPVPAVESVQIERMLTEPMDVERTSPEPLMEPAQMHVEQASLEPAIEPLDVGRISPEPLVEPAQMQMQIEQASSELAVEHHFVVQVPYVERSSPEPVVQPMPVKRTSLESALGPMDVDEGLMEPALEPSVVETVPMEPKLSPEPEKKSAEVEKPSGELMQEPVVQQASREPTLELADEQLSQEHALEPVDEQPSAEQEVENPDVEEASELTPEDVEEAEPTNEEAPDTPAVARERFSRRRSTRFASEAAEASAASAAAGVIVLTEAEAEELELPPLEVHQKRFKSPSGIIILEELDTPATRRKKSMLRKAGKLATEAAAAAALLSVGPSVAGPSRQPAEEDNADMESNSDLTSLGDASDKEAELEQPAAVSPSGSRLQIQPAQVVGVYTTRQVSQLQHAPSTDPGAVVLGEGEYLEGGTLVWAKAKSFPWWPAVVFEEDDLAIPPYVLRAKGQDRENEEGPLHLVRFFDSGNSWQWVELPDLKLLGEDTRLDDDMLARNSRRQKWKNSHIRQDCRKAYRQAMAERETDGNEGYGPGPANVVTVPTQVESHAAMDVDNPLDADSPMTEIDS